MLLSNFIQKWDYTIPEAYRLAFEQDAQQCADGDLDRTVFWNKYKEFVPPNGTIQANKRVGDLWEPISNSPFSFKDLFLNFYPSGQPSADGTMNSKDAIRLTEQVNSAFYWIQLPGLNQGVLYYDIAYLGLTANLTLVLHGAAVQVSYTDYVSPVWTSEPMADATNRVIEIPAGSDFVINIGSGELDTATLDGNDIQPDFIAGEYTLCKFIADSTFEMTTIGG